MTDLDPKIIKKALNSTSDVCILFVDNKTENQFECELTKKIFWGCVVYMIEFNGCFWSYKTFKSAWKKFNYFIDKYNLEQFSAE